MKLTISKPSSKKTITLSKPPKIRPAGKNSNANGVLAKRKPKRK